MYDRKNALVAADLLNDRVLPFFEQQGVRLLGILTDRGSEYCGSREGKSSIIPNIRVAMLLCILKDTCRGISKGYEIIFS
jgi:hypothetical protein